jgi:hypothetical protein
MLDMGIRTARLAEPEVIPCQHRSWLIGIPGACSRTPGGVALDGVEPAHQVSCRASHRRSPRLRVRLFQVQPAHAGDAGNRLSPDLNEVVLAGKQHGTADHRVLRRFRDRRPTALGTRWGKPPVTGQSRADQENTPENFTTCHFAAYPA